MSPARLPERARAAAPEGEGLSSGDTAPIPPAVLDEAIAWAVRLDFGTPDPQTRAAFERWREAAAPHALAWSRLQTLHADFAAVPDRLALDTLNAMETAHQARRQRRRAVLKGVVLAGGVLGSGWLAREHTPWQRLVADLSTRVGQRQTTTLADGTWLALNTDTAVGVAMTGAERILTLYRGEIAVRTGADAAAATRRAFLVRTPFGEVRALGTRFVVRLDPAGAQVSVQQDAVALRAAADLPPALAEAGQVWRMDRQRAYRLATPAMAPDAWLQGAVSGTHMRLGDLLAELGRHRHGHLGWAPEVAGLPVSGTYHLDDIDQTLRFLAQTLPIRLRYWTRYWITVDPA